MRRFLYFYIDGFKSMTLGKKLWAIIFIKLVIIFFVFKLFFFPNILKENYDNDDDRARAVAYELTNDNRQMTTYNSRYHGRNY